MFNLLFQTTMVNIPIFSRQAKHALFRTPNLRFLAGASLYPPSSNSNALCGLLSVNSTNPKGNFTVIPSKHVNLPICSFTKIAHNFLHLNSHIANLFQQCGKIQRKALAHQNPFFWGAREKRNPQTPLKILIYY